jgi:hypothetical protein
MSYSNVAFFGLAGASLQLVRVCWGRRGGGGGWAAQGSIAGQVPGGPVQCVTCNHGKADSRPTERARC